MRKTLQLVSLLSILSALSGCTILFGGLAASSRTTKTLNQVIPSSQINALKSGTSVCLYLSNEPEQSGTFIGLEQLLETSDTAIVSPHTRADRARWLFLEPDESITVFVGTTSGTEGRYLSIEQDSLTMETAYRRVTVPLEAVTRVVTARHSLDGDVLRGGASIPGTAIVIDLGGTQHTVRADHVVGVQVLQQTKRRGASSALLVGLAIDIAIVAALLSSIGNAEFN